MTLLVKLNDRKPLALTRGGALGLITAVQSILDLLECGHTPTEIHTYIQEDQHATPLTKSTKPNWTLTLKLHKTGSLKSLHLSTT